MMAALAGLQRRLAELEEQAREQTGLGMIFYDRVTGHTIVSALDGRTFRGAEAERLIAPETESVGTPCWGGRRIPANRWMKRSRGH
jgi:hypothetical protein